MKKRVSFYFKYLSSIVFVIVLFVVISTGNNKSSVITFNNNKTKSVEASNIASAEVIAEQKMPVLYETIEEAIGIISSTNETVSFTGKLTGYGPDCKGCSGGVACPPGKKVTNGNIYYTDDTYGSIRIVAADKKIPCGSIMKITGISIYDEPIVAVVMDRGSGVKSNHIDLLFESEKNMGGFGTQKGIQFDILRWGW